MNYELAKQLKDAGFPQKSKGFPMPEGTKIHGDGTLELPPDTPEPVHLPHLSELIESCGDNFHSLRQGVHSYHGRVTSRSWGAKGKNRGTLDDYIGTKGQTPEEAVAKLWLALQV